MKIKSQSILPQRNFDLFIAIITWLGLAMQAGASKNIANTFSYFTVLTNLLIALSLSLTIVIPASGVGRFFAKVSVQSSLTAYIIIVSVIYNFAIRSSWSQPAYEFVYNNILHVVTPLLFVLRWLIFVPKGTLKWSNSISWLVFPLFYLLYSLIRGKIINWYPYFFIDLRDISYLEAGRNILFVLLAFLIVGSLLVFLNRILKSKGVTNRV